MPVFLLYAGIIHAIGLALFLPVLITLPGPAREVRPAPKTSAVDVVILPAAEPLTDIGPEQTSALPAAPSVHERNAKGAAAPVAAKPDLGEESKDDIEVVAPAAGPEAKPPLAAKPPRESREAETPPGDGAEASHEKKETVAHVSPEAEAHAEPVPQQAEAPETGPSQTAPEADKPAKQEPETQKTTPAKASTQAKDAAPVKATPRAAKKPSARRSTTKRAPGRTASRTAKSQTKFAPFNGALSGMFGPPANKRR